jgi:recombinational DNA repair protein RecT
MTQEIKSNEAESVETKEIQQFEQVKAPVKLNKYDELEQKLHKYDKDFVQEFIKNIKNIIPLIPVGKNEAKRPFLTNEEIASLLEYASFGIDISPKAGMLYYFSRGGQFGFLTPRAIIEMLGKIGITATVEVICSNDQFKVDPANLQIKHLLALPRGETIGVYAILREKGKIIAIEVMDMNELIKIQSIADKYKKSATWETFFEEMAKKTMLKRIAKRTPLLDNNNIKQALEIDNKEYSKPETTEKLNNVAVTTQPERI